MPYMSNSCMFQPLVTLMAQRPRVITSMVAPHLAMEVGWKNPGWMAVMRRIFFVQLANSAVIARQSRDDASISSPDPHHRWAMRRLEMPMSSYRRTSPVVRSVRSSPSGITVLGVDSPLTTCIPPNTVGAPRACLHARYGNQDFPVNCIVMRGLRNKTAVVTGAGSGLGRGMAQRLADEGVKVAILDLNLTGAEETATAIGASGGTASAHEVDIADYAACQAAIAAVEAEHGPVDVLVNNAGWDKAMPFLDTEPELWRKIIDINLYGPLHMQHVVAPKMLARGGGKIINIASDAGRVGSSGEAVYSACKGGVIAFGKTLSRELARKGVIVNTVCPGPSDTPLFADFAGEGEAGEKLRSALERSIPMRRLGTADDIAGIVAFLASDESRLHRRPDHQRLRRADHAWLILIPTYSLTSPRTSRSSRRSTCASWRRARGAANWRPVVPNSLVNAGGFAHGAIAFALMDTACAYALRSLGRSGVTLNANVTYVRGGKEGDTLRGVTYIATQTRRVATFRAETWLETDDEPILAAHGTFVFQLRDL